MHREQIPEVFRQTRAKALLPKVSTNSSTTSCFHSDVAELIGYCPSIALRQEEPSFLLHSTPAPVQAVRDLPGNPSSTTPKRRLKGESLPEASVAYQGPPIPTSSDSEANTRGDKGPMQTLLVHKVSAAPVQPPWKFPLRIMIQLFATFLSPTLTPYGDIDFLLLKEADSFLVLADDPDCPAYKPCLKELISQKSELSLRSVKLIQPILPLMNLLRLNSRNCLPISSMHFWRATTKIARHVLLRELDVEEKSALIKVLKSHKRALAWKLSDIQGINPEFCTHKILMEEDYAPAVQHQRRVNPKIHDVIKKEVEKLLEAGLFTLSLSTPTVPRVARYIVYQKKG
ncbi:hypothetical protein Tco_0952268 [Tanacetum coccineum]|uniref:Uncharacterized protein n=1 Tax=Tanacetum coccineum TaxID=301880 RepID=A0ABQ5DX48_9ASTR